MHAEQNSLSSLGVWTERTPKKAREFVSEPSGCICSTCCTGLSICCWCAVICLGSARRCGGCWWSLMILAPSIICMTKRVFGPICLFLLKILCSVGSTEISQHDPGIAVSIVMLSTFSHALLQFYWTLKAVLMQHIICHFHAGQGHSRKQLTCWVWLGIRCRWC